MSNNAETSTADPGSGRPEILLLSGPNLSLLGQREPEVYGTATLDDHVESARAEADAHGLALDAAQSDHEGEMVERIHAARDAAAGIIINGGAFSHYSWAIHDALATFDGPIIELHISNPGSREEFRHTSVLTPVSTAVIQGMGGAGYPLAVRSMAILLGILTR
ncbi:MAG: type II 3-dehydroquinate dehydratase [Microthrixaceae bacterium]